MTLFTLLHRSEYILDGSRARKKYKQFVFVC